MALAVSMKVNGRSVTDEVEPNTLLVDFIRNSQRLTGTHVGCDTSQCGACVVHVNGRSVKSCTMLAVQADGADVTTIEGVAGNGDLHPLQAAFREHHARRSRCPPGKCFSAPPARRGSLPRCWHLPPACPLDVRGIHRPLFDLIALPTRPSIFDPGGAPSPRSERRERRPRVR